MDFNADIVADAGDVAGTFLLASRTRKIVRENTGYG